MDAFTKLRVAMSLQPVAEMNLGDKPAVGSERGAWTVSPDAARDLARIARGLASALDAAADEAESVPRFSEEDIDAMLAEANYLGMAPIMRGPLRDKLRALRKPRS